MGMDDIKLLLVEHRKNAVTQELRDRAFPEQSDVPSKYLVREAIPQRRASVQYCVYRGIGCSWIIQLV